MKKTGRKKSSTAKNLGREELLAAELFDRYSRVILHPDYRCFCNTYEEYFDKDGIFEFNNQSIKSERYDEPSEIYLELTRIREKFGLSRILYHHRLETRPTIDDMLAIPLFESTGAVEDYWHLEGPEDNISPQLLTTVVNGNFIIVKISLFHAYSIKDIAHDVSDKVRFARSELGLKNMRGRKYTGQAVLFFNADSSTARVTDNDLSWVVKSVGDANSLPLAACNDQYILAKIDISPEINVKIIVDQIINYIMLARCQIGSEERRRRFEENQTAYRVFENHEYLKITFKDIAIKLRLPSKQAAHDKYARAKTLLGLSISVDDNELARKGQWEKIAPAKKLSSKEQIGRSKDASIGAKNPLFDDSVETVFQVINDICPKCRDKKCSDTMVEALNNRDIDAIIPHMCGHLKQELKNSLSSE